MKILLFYSFLFFALKLKATNDQQQTILPDLNRTPPPSPLNLISRGNELGSTDQQERTLNVPTISPIPKPNQKGRIALNAALESGYPKKSKEFKRIYNSIYHQEMKKDPIGKQKLREYENRAKRNQTKSRKQRQEQNQILPQDIYFIEKRRGYSKIHYDKHHERKKLEAKLRMRQIRKRRKEESLQKQDNDGN